MSGIMNMVVGTFQMGPTLPVLWSWGKNVGGQLGLSNATYYASPKQIGTLTTWSTVATGTAHSLAIKTDGTLWTWGANGGSGALGLGNTSNYSSPVQVGALTTWTTSAGGAGNSAAIKANTLWTWGANAFGSLGLGNSTYYSSPKQVGALTDWSKISMSGFYWCMAIKTDGTLWTWGYNGYGQLGDGSTTTRSSPVQVGALTDWLQVSAGYYHTAGIRTNGTIWGWGRNLNGQLGLSDNGSRSSPVQIGALTDWYSLKSGSKSHTYGIKTDGTLWAWGAGTSGALGNGSTTDRFSPVQVGALTTWANVYPGMFFCQATTTAGALWAWGDNGYGRLGLGNTTSISSPAQVGSLTGWVMPSRGSGSHTIAIR